MDYTSYKDIKYYKECLDDYEAHNLAKTKIEQISSKWYDFCTKIE